MMACRSGTLETVEYLVSKGLSIHDFNEVSWCNISVKKSMNRPISPRLRFHCRLCFFPPF